MTLSAGHSSLYHLLAWLHFSPLPLNLVRPTIIVPMSLRNSGETSTFLRICLAHRSTSTNLTNKVIIMPSHSKAQTKLCASAERREIYPRALTQLADSGRLSYLDGRMVCNISGSAQHRTAASLVKQGHGRTFTMCPCEHYFFEYTPPANPLVLTDEQKDRIKRQSAIMEALDATIGLTPDEDQQ
jgi:hypothetical protein